MEDRDFSVNDLLLNDSFIKWLKSPDEATDAYWKEWIALNPDKIRAVAEAKKIILLLKEDHVRLSEKRVSALKQNIDFGINSSSEANENVFDNLIRKISYYKVAAVLLVALCISILVYFFKSGKEGLLLSGDAEYVNTQGKPLKKILTDGTVVWLNTESKLRAPEKFSESTRDVYIEGEVFFDVKKDQDHPFIVHTSQLDIKVYGTSFNVKAYKSDEFIQTTLVEGKVTVSERNGINRKMETVLKPSQQATFLKNDKTLVVSKVNIQHYSSWKDNQLVFNSMEVSEVIKTLQRRFDIEIKVSNHKLNNCRINGDFTGQPLDIVLELLSKSIEAQVIKNGKIITLKGKGCNKNETGGL